MTLFSLTLESRPDAADIAAVRAGLRAYNLAAVPELARLPAPDVAVFARGDGGEIIGGASGEADWGWFQIETLWVQPSRRRMGLGSRLMAALEGAACDQGVNRAYLTATGAPALAFFRKAGYQVWGELRDRPRGFVCTYLKKEQLEPAALSQGIEIQVPPNPDGRHLLDRAVLADTSACRQEDQPLTVFAREEGEIVGGIVGTTCCGWLELRFMWVKDRRRGAGLGSRLLALAEAECLRRGVHNAAADTADFQALPFYQKHGYVIVGTLPDRPPGHISYYLRKSLIAGGW